MKELTWETMHPFDKKPLTKRLDKDQCINVELIRLGSAPPYRHYTKLKSDSILPTLSNKSPRLFQILKQQSKRRNSSKDISFREISIGKIKEQEIKGGGLNNSEELKIGRLNKSSDEVLLDNFHDILDKKYSQSFIEDTTKLMRNDESDKKKKDKLKILALSNNKRVIPPLTNSSKMKAKNNIPSLESEELSVSTDTYEKLKVAGIGLTHSNINKEKYTYSDNNNTPRSTTKSFNVDTKQKTGFYYRKQKSITNQSLPNDMKSVNQSIRRVDLFHRGLYNNSKVEMTRPLTQEMISLREYCRIENQRYIIDCKTIKTVLFHRWLGHAEHFLGKYQPVHVDILSEEETAEENEEESEEYDEANQSG